MKDGKPTPEDIMVIAYDSPIVEACLCIWRKGDLTWEQALMAAVITLAHCNASLTQDCIRLTQMQPPAPIIVDSNLLKKEPL